VGDCPFKKTWNAAPTPPALPTRVAPPALSASLMRRNPWPIDRGAPLPSQGWTLAQTQRGLRTGVGREKG